MGEAISRSSIQPDMANRAAVGRYSSSLANRRMAGYASIASQDPHRSLPVVPLIGDKRYYGEAPARLPGRSGAGWEE
jgi:hypothetical protein